MPHKMNSRSCERINGLHVVLKGYLAMAAGLAGDQWNEGDVSCSVVRRVMLPDAFLAMDGLLETLLTVLDADGSFRSRGRSSELQRYLPFLAHHHGASWKRSRRAPAAKARTRRSRSMPSPAIRDLRTGKIVQNDLLPRLAADPRLGLSPAELQSVLDQGRANSGDAAAQVDHFARQVDALAEARPEAASYTPGAIL